MSVSKTSSPFHSQVPAPGFSGGSVQFTAGEINISHIWIFLKSNETYKGGTVAIPLERPSCRRRDRSHWTPPSDCPTLIGLKNHPLAHLTQSKGRPIGSGSWHWSWNLLEIRPRRALSGSLQAAKTNIVKRYIIVFANEGLHLEGRGIAPRHKSPVCRFLSMFGSNCIPSTLNFD